MIDKGKSPSIKWLWFALAIGNRRNVQIPFAQYNILFSFQYCIFAAIIFFKPKTHTKHNENNCFAKMIYMSSLIVGSFCSFQL
jgi:hypothetical protein